MIPLEPAVENNIENGADYSNDDESGMYNIHTVGIRQPLQIFMSHLCWKTLG